MKRDHDLECASRRRPARSCDCQTGMKRRTRKAAQTNLKRAKVDIIEGIISLEPRSFTPFRLRHPNG